MKVTLTFELPEEAPGSMQVEYARRAAVQLLEQFEGQWPGFRKRAAAEPDGRCWLYVNRRNGRSQLDKLVVVATECRAKTPRDQIVELQRALRLVVVGFDDKYPGLYSRLAMMMREGAPIGVLLRRLIGGRPIASARSETPPGTLSPQGNKTPCIDADRSGP